MDIQGQIEIYQQWMLWIEQTYLCIVIGSHPVAALTGE